MTYQLKMLAFVIAAFAMFIPVVVLLVLFGGPVQESHGQMFGTKEQLIKSMENLFDINDQWAMDAEPFPDWGPYWCAHFTKGKGTMIHFAKDPSRDDADVVLLVQAEALIKDAGLNPDALPQLTQKPYGPGLTSGQWYYVPEFKLLLLPMSAEEIGMTKNLVPRVKQ